MDMLKKIFPLSFGATDVVNLVIRAVVYLIAGLLGGFIIGIVAGVPVVGWLMGLVGGAIDLYVLVAIVLLALDYFQVLK